MRRFVITKGDVTGGLAADSHEYFSGEEGIQFPWVSVQVAARYVTREEAEMDDRIAQELRHFVCAAVDACAGLHGLVGRNVANRTTDQGEELLSCQGVGACGEACVAGWRTCVADFIYKAFQFGLVRLGVWSVERSGASAGRVRRVFVRVEAVAHAEFVAQ